jgi:hypothetical protein
MPTLQAKNEGQMATVPAAADNADEYPVMHDFHITNFLSEAQIVESNVGSLVEELEAYCKATIAPFQGLRIDFGGVNLISEEAAGSLGDFVAHFRRGRLCTEPDADRAVYLSFANLLGPSARTPLSRAINPAIISAPRDQGTNHGLSELEWNVVGPTKSILRTRLVFSLLWNSTSPLSPKDIKKLVTAQDPKITNKAVDDHIHILNLHRLIAKRRDKRYVRVA